MNKEQTLNSLPLKGKVQHYAWGGDHFIPELIGIPNNQPPYAEYWMGAHPGASAEVVINGEHKSLYQLIKANPKLYIGEQVNQRFGELPYLFKVLDVQQMLSIQVHPTKEAAEKEYRREEEAGIPIDAPQRNYKDRNHKPEVMVALSEFWLLHGFKSKSLLTAQLQSEPAFHFLQNSFRQGDYKALYQEVMELPKAEVDRILLPLVQKVVQAPETDKSSPAYWVHKLYKDNPPVQNLDRGIFSIYFFNIVHLQPGQGIFQGAGIPHAYLEGQNMELMANSDNVLRGGLTPKHIDVTELLKHVVFEETIPVVMEGRLTKSGEAFYDCPVSDFGLSCVRLERGQSYNPASFSGEIFFVLEGIIKKDDDDQPVKKGASFYLLPAKSIHLEALEKSVLFRAFVPVL